MTDTTPPPSDTSGLDGQDDKGSGGDAVLLDPFVVTTFNANQYWAKQLQIRQNYVFNYTIYVRFGLGYGSGGGGGAPDGSENPDCAKLRLRMAAAQAVYDRHSGYFQPGGQYHDYADSLGGYDQMAFANTVVGASSSVRAFYLSGLPTQKVQRLALGAETFRDVAGSARAAGRFAIGIGIIGVATDVAYLANYSVDGDGANALLSSGNIVYGVGGLVATGPVGLLIAGTYAGVNGSLYLYQTYEDNVDRKNLRNSAQSSVNAINTAQQVGAAVAAEMKQKGCK